jgi:hypothetical protein
MKVKELIDLLKKYPEEKEIGVYNCDWGDVYELEIEDEGEHLEIIETDELIK